MKKLFLLLILSYFSTQSLAGSCPDGSEPIRSISADGTYFVFSCSDNNERSSSNTFKIQNPDKYCPSVILPNDVASGSKFGVCLADKTAFKEYGLQVVDKTDGHPVRAGNKSLRFELRDGDCNNPPPPNWNDCKTDRERFELSGHDMYSGEEWWYAWSIFIPMDFINIYPALLDLGQFHLEPTPEGDPCCNLMFKNGMRGYNLENPIKNFELHQLLTHSEMAGRWNDILINFKLSNKNNGFIKLWLNKKLVYEYTGPTMTKNTEFVYKKFGIYRGGLSRYLNHKNFSTEVEACFENNGASKELIKATKKGGHSQVLGLGANSPSFKIYNQCKHLYKIKLPTQIVYYDEVRAGKTKEEVVGNLPPRIKNTKESESKTAEKVKLEAKPISDDGEIHIVDGVQYQIEGQILKVYTADSKMKPLNRNMGSLMMKCGSGLITGKKKDWLSFVSSESNDIKKARNKNCHYQYFQKSKDSEAFDLFKVISSRTDSILNQLKKK